MKHKTSISHDEAMVRGLRKDPEFAAEYLRAALEDEDEPRVLLVALRRVAEARGGIAKVAKAAGVERESLYRALSAHGNPRLSTLVRGNQSRRASAYRRSRAIKRHLVRRRLHIVGASRGPSPITRESPYGSPSIG